MYIAYFDESGDDGHPKTSSNQFVLSTLYFHYLHWQSNFNEIYKFRNELKTKYKFPIRTEIHTRNFVLNKNPYANFRISDENRLKIIGMSCDLIARLDLKIINVVIIKDRIKNENYDVLDNAFKYCIQRIDNDLKPEQHPDNKLYY